MSPRGSRPRLCAVIRPASIRADDIGSKCEKEKEKRGKGGKEDHGGRGVGGDGWQVGMPYAGLWWLIWCRKLIGETQLPL